MRKTMRKLTESKMQNFLSENPEEILPEYYEKYAKDHPGEHAHADVIVVDPPRKGCEGKSAPHHGQHAAGPALCMYPAIPQRWHEI